jgi:hypothetical protein
MKRQKLELSLTGTDTGFESTASRVEIFITWRPIKNYLARFVSDWQRLEPSLTTS